MSYGLLSLEPKDRDGNPIENLEDQAIMEGDRELKAWDAIARYMQSFEDTDGDGMPDAWEAANGLNPKSSADGVKYNLSKEYTNLEVYINSLVEKLYPAK